MYTCVVVYNDCVLQILSGTVVPVLTPSQFEGGLNITVLPTDDW